MRGWRLAALLASGVAIGVLMVGTPAGAHVGGSVNHLWNHLKPKADKRYVNESELLWAVVRDDGTLVRDHGATHVTTAGTGNYRVFFNRNVRQCAYVATIGLPGASGTESPGEITVVGAAVDVKAVFVTTDDSAGASAERGFHLMVNCGKTSSSARVAPSSAGVDGGGGANSG
jgi:hypothetical protein